MSLILFPVFVLSGCKTLPYRYSSKIESPRTVQLRPGEPQIERGRPNKFVDGIGHYFFSMPGKLLLWNWKVDCHRISPDTEGYIKRYLEDNDLDCVKVRLNQYAPGAEWRRLFKNHSVGWFWRILIGVPSVFLYMVLPERVFGGDNYNPYTNTISIYSDHPAIVLHEGGHSKDFAGRKYKGTYSVLYMLPIFPLYTEGIATRDAIGYLKDKQDIKAQKNSYKVLYPAYTTYIGGEFANFFPMTDIITAGLIIPAHIVGRIKAGSVKEKPLNSTEGHNEKLS